MHKYEMRETLKEAYADEEKLEVAMRRASGLDAEVQELRAFKSKCKCQETDHKKMMRQLNETNKEILARISKW